MFEWIAKNSRTPVTRLAVSAMLLVPAVSSAQAPPPVSPAQFDPSDVYFQAYLAKRDAEKLEQAGDFVGASEKLKHANKLSETVREFYPAWKPEMVGGNIAQNYENLTRLFPKAKEQKEKKRSVVAELEGGAQASGTLIDPAEDVMPLTPGILEVNPLETKRLAEAEAEVERLRDQLKQTPPSEAEATRNETRVRDLARQRDLAQSQLKAAENNLQILRGQLASKPVESERKALDERIARVEQERDAMNLALTQSRSEHMDAQARIATLEADLKLTQQKYADLERNLKTSSDIANSVVAGQRTQLRAMEKELQQKSAELGQANERIAGLIKELDESRDAFTQLRTERDALLQERDRMSDLLSLNEDGRIQDLIQQNMGLAKNLREANEKVERLNLDNNSTKDDVIVALQNLAIAKSQINKLHQEKREQDQRLAELEKRLQGEETALANGQASNNPEEVAMLRDIIQRQLRVQERRRQARDLLIQAVKDMGAKDEQLSKAVELFDGETIQLTPEEQRLLAEKEVDGEFVSPFAQDRSIVGRNTNELNRDIAVFERTAEKSFAAGRMLPTRELFQMIVEQHPGHIPALCKLGVVHLKLQDPTSAVDTFRRAVELDTANPYAHRMLGLAFMQLGDIPSAEQSLKEAVSLAPDDVKSYMLLGRIAFGKRDYPQAESYFKTAISADPVLSDPYYNLAVICSRTKRMDSARDHYHQALERGAVPDPALEELLAKP
jgi:predicted Zn-dependent protease